MTPYYESGGVTIWHGDCRDVLDEWEGLPATSFDLLLTDPPYGHGYAADPIHHAKNHVPRGWDDASAQALVNRARAVCRSQIVFGGNYYALPPSRCWLVWHKPDSVPSTADVELAWTNFDKPARFLSHTIAATNRERVGHPTQKPEPVMRWALLQAPPDVQTVLDPFMGSGSTLVACKRLGRACTGIEIEERFCEIAVRRLAQEVLPLEEVCRK